VLEIFGILKCRLVLFAVDIDMTCLNSNCFQSDGFDLIENLESSILVSLGMIESAFRIQIEIAIRNLSYH
jgi:hypothetical protein